MKIAGVSYNRECSGTLNSTCHNLRVSADVFIRVKITFSKFLMYCTTSYVLDHILCEKNLQDIYHSFTYNVT